MSLLRPLAGGMKEHLSSPCHTAVQTTVQTCVCCGCCHRKSSGAASSARATRGATAPAVARASYRNLRRLLLYVYTVAAAGT
eukprot:10595618-Alexandrium_andersonii.AAC.1